MRLSAPIFRLKRQAKMLSRETSASLHAALDQVATKEGFQSWSHLAASVADDPAAKLLAYLRPGDLVLLGARPGHGKTLLGLKMALEAVRAGRPALYFSLEETEAMICDRLRGLGFDPRQAPDTLKIDTSDHICADYVIERVREHPAGCLAVIDYLQLLDHRRINPGLGDQIEALAAFTRTVPSTILTLAQIDRSFETGQKALPGLADVRLPNRCGLSLFTSAWFLHDGQLRIEGTELRASKH